MKWSLHRVKEIDTIRCLDVIRILIKVSKLFKWTDRFWNWFQYSTCLFYLIGITRKFFVQILKVTFAIINSRRVILDDIGQWYITLWATSFRFHESQDFQKGENSFLNRKSQIWIYFRKSQNKGKKSPHVELLIFWTCCQNRIWSLWMLSSWPGRLVAASMPRSLSFKFTEK